MSENSTMKKVAPKLEKAQNEALAKCASVSAKMRYLDAQGFTRGDISRILNKRYQHVKNVLDRPLKKIGA
jgi:hypothetical protein